eukprot:XP_011666827.1 PREDICTED: uncharacterized protein LOC105439483 isoform X1 [Strongylocentrotus purpuratus]
MNCKRRNGLILLHVFLTFSVLGIHAASSMGEVTTQSTEECGLEPNFLCHAHIYLYYNDSLLWNDTFWICNYGYANMSVRPIPDCCLDTYGPTSAGFNITDGMTEEVTCSIPQINLPRHNTDSMTFTSPYGTHVFPRVPHYDVSNNSNSTNASINDVTYFIYDNFVIGPGADNSFFNANEDHMKATLPHVVQLLYAYFSMETTQTLFVTAWDLKVVDKVNISDYSNGCLLNSSDTVAENLWSTETGYRGNRSQSGCMTYTGLPPSNILNDSAILLSFGYNITSTYGSEDQPIMSVGDHIIICLPDDDNTLSQFGLQVNLSCNASSFESDNWTVTFKASGAGEVQINNVQLLILNDGKEPILPFTTVSPNYNADSNKVVISVTVVLSITFIIALIMGALWFKKRYLDINRQPQSPNSSEPTSTYTEGSNDSVEFGYLNSTMHEGNWDDQNSDLMILGE